MALVGMTWLDKLDAMLANFKGRSTSRSLHENDQDRIAATSKATQQDPAELRLEDERTWAAPFANSDADLARIGAQLAQESNHIQAQLNAEAHEAKQADLFYRRDEKANAESATKAKINAQIIALEAKRQAAQHEHEQHKRAMAAAA